MMRSQLAVSVHEATQHLPTPTRAVPQSKISALVEFGYHTGLGGFESLVGTAANYTSFESNDVDTATALAHV